MKYFNLIFTKFQNTKEHPEMLIIQKLNELNKNRFETPLITRLHGLQALIILGIQNEKGSSS